MDIQVGCWKAPYSGQSITSFRPPQAVEPAYGDILLIRTSSGTSPSPDDGGAAPVQGLVREMRRRFPGSPVAIWVAEGIPEFVIDLVRDATAANVRAILGGPVADPVRLRLQLTHPEGLSAFVLRWASDAGYLPSGVSQQEVQELLDAPPNVRTLQRLVLERQQAARTWRKHLQQLGLPTPHAWLGLAHSLHVAFFVQRNSTEPLQRLAEQLGMQSVAHFSQTFRRVFGLCPSHVRDLLGPEPLLYRWFQARTRR